MYRRSALACLVAGTLAAAGSLGPARRSLAATSIDVKAGEFSFTPKSLAAPAGETLFRVTNEGTIEHNFFVQDAQGRTVASIPVIGVGATEETGATLAPGSYRVVCTFPGHAEAGMVGTLTVR